MQAKYPEEGEGPATPMRRKGARRRIWRRTPESATQQGMMQNRGGPPQNPEGDKPNWGDRPASDEGTQAKRKEPRVQPKTREAAQCEKTLSVGEQPRKPSQRH